MMMNELEAQRSEAITNNQIETFQIETFKCSHLVSDLQRLRATGASAGEIHECLKSAKSSLAKLEQISTEVRNDCAR